MASKQKSPEPAVQPAPAQQQQPRQAIAYGQPRDGSRARPDFRDEQAIILEIGDSITGRIIGISMRSTKFSGVDKRTSHYVRDCPVVIIDAGDEDLTFAFWAFHATARSQLAELSPQIGDELTIVRLPDETTGGAKGSGYRNYKVYGDRTARPFDWSNVHPAGYAPEPPSESARRRRPADAFASDDEDLPF